MIYSFNLNITPGGMPPVLHMSQYDTGRTYAVTIKDADGSNVGLGTNPTAKVKGFNGKNCFEIDATVASSVVTFTLTEASTDQFGVFPVTIELTIDGQDIISPLCMIFDVQKAGYTNEQAASSPEFENAMEEAAQKYVLGMDESARIALLDLLAYAAYTGPDAQAKFDTLETALQAKLAYIVADYVQDRTVYDTDSLDKIKEGDDLIVTAYYDDGSYSDLEDSQYTLSGTLTAGTSTITVTYGGKTATFDVTVTAYWDIEWDYTQGTPIGHGFAHLTAVAGSMVTNGYQIQGTSNGGCNIITDPDTTAGKGVTEVVLSMSHMGTNFDNGATHISVKGLFALIFVNSKIYYSLGSLNGADAVQVGSASINTDYKVRVEWDTATGATVYVNDTVAYTLTTALTASRTRWQISATQTNDVALIKSMKVRVEA